MSATILPPTTAGIAPEKFSDAFVFARRTTLAWIALVIFLTIGFALRVNQLGSESLGEDEFNKLQTVEEYRHDGLTGKNGEHPFLMKGLQTVSIATAGKFNDLFSSHISEEAALRFPVALFGTFSILLIFLLVSELFGRSIGLRSATLWAVEPMAVGFDRVAKEDSLVLFFFLLASLFFIKSQTAAQHGNSNWRLYFWASAASFGGLMASKYYPHLLGVLVAYYNLFINLPGDEWQIGRQRWLKFLVIMGIAFLIFNPTIMLPETWREMAKFSSESRIGHDSYEFMGRLYTHRMTDWLAGVPWTFYYVFIAVKSSVIVLAFFLVGLGLMFRRRLGDGRFFIFFWAFLWFMPFTIMGGKFTRYFALAEPLILITAAVGFCFTAKWLTHKFFPARQMAAVFRVLIFAVFLSMPLRNSLAVAPHFRLFTNFLAGGMAAAGSYFPHDEFYDGSTREIIAAIAPLARPGAVVACETPSLFEYYAGKNGRSDLIFVSLSDKNRVAGLRSGDFIVIARGRRYFSNTAYEEFLSDAVPTAEIKVLGITSARIYQLNESSTSQIQSLPRQSQS